MANSNPAFSNRTISFLFFPFGLSPEMPTKKRAVGACESHRASCSDPGLRGWLAGARPCHPGCRR